MTELLISEDGVFGPDIEARTKHQLSIDTFEWRGGVAPRKRPNPEVHELRSGQTVEGDGWKVTTRSVIHVQRSEEHTSELQSLMRISYAVFCLKKKNNTKKTQKTETQ